MAKEKLRRGEAAAAQSICEALIASAPAPLDAWHVSGLAMASQGKLAGAIRRLRRATLSADASPLYVRDFGIALLAARRWKAAAGAFERTLTTEPDDSRALALYARALLELGRTSEARDTCLKALRHEPKDAKVLLNIARTLRRLSADADAIACLERVLRHDPDSADAYWTLLQMYRERRRYDDALHCARLAARKLPANTDLTLQYGIALFDAGRTLDALKKLIRIQDQGPHRQDVHSTSINVLLHEDHHTGDALLAETCLWENRHCVGIRPRRTFDNDPDPNRILRIGYLTGEFATVPSYQFLYPLISAHDRNSFEVYCFHSRPESDDFTANLRRVSHHWRDVSRQSDRELARGIQRSGIDILVDCSGHYPYNRLLTFARKPAPVQVTYPNYPGTTGLSTFDAILTDKWTTPAGTEQEYAEPVRRLPSGYLCYTPSECAPPVAPPVRDGIQFGVFQRPGKLTQAFWDVAAEAMKRLPGSRLLVQYASADLHDRRSPSSRNVLAQMGRRGIAEERITLCGDLPKRQWLELLSGINVALDTFPYNGQTTTCECLWMGVPVITLYGRSHVGRVGGGMLRRIGLDSFVAENLREYLDIAVEVSGDHHRLDELRASMRSRLTSSTLMKPGVVTAEVESAYRALWLRWCQKYKAKSVEQRHALTGV